MIEKHELAEHIQQIEKYAADYGLDFFPVIFEMLDSDQINMVASYGGFPMRYPHWRFGMQYEYMGKELRIRSPQDLRNGDQQQPLLRIPIGLQPTCRPKTSDWACVRAL